MQENYDMTEEKTLSEFAERDMTAEIFNYV